MTHANRLLVSFLIAASTSLASCGGGGGGGGGVDPVSPQNSTVRADVPFGTEADGAGVVTITVTVLDPKGDPIPGRTVELTTEGVGASLAQPASPTDAMGRTTGTLTALVAGAQTVRATVDPGGTPTVLDEQADVTFVRTPPDARYVRVGGSDAANGTRPLSAWATITHALTQLQPGQTLYVGGGLYAENPVLSTSGSPGAPIVLRGDPDGRFTGDVGPTRIEAGGGAFGLHLASVSDVVVRGFSVRDARPGLAAGGAIWVDGGARVHLVENDVYESDRGIEVANAQDVLLEGNRVSNCDGSGGDGIRLSQTNGVRSRNDLVYNNARYGLYLVGGAVATTLENDTFFQNGGDQVHEEGSGSSGSIRDSIVAEGDSAGILLVGGTGLTETFNLVWGHAGPDVQIGSNPPAPPSGGSVDPLLADPAGVDGILGGANGDDDDFRLLAASPALDAGSDDARELSLAWGGSLRGRTTRTDALQDGQGADASTVNLGHHAGVAQDSFGALASTEARLFSAGGTDVRPAVRRRGSTGSWGAAAHAAPLNEDVRWMVHAVSPGSGAEEFLAALSVQSGGTTLAVRHFDGRLWSEDDPFRDVVSAIDPADADQRGFDLAVEQGSGDALLVYADGDANPVYRTFSSGRWSADQDVFATAPSAGKVLWVELVARTGSDQIALVTLDDTQTLSALVWDGSSWSDAGVPTVLDTRIAELYESKAFDAAWETQSGDLLVAWGYTLVIEETRYAQRSATSGTWTMGQHSSTDAVGSVFRLASDPTPTSNRIVAGVAEGSHGNDIVGMIWDGSTWSDVASDLVFGANGPTGQRDVAVGWVGTSGEAVIVLSRSVSSGFLQWGRWRFNASGGWNNRPDVAVSGLGSMQVCEVRSVPGVNQLVAVLVDDNGALFALRLASGVWTLEGGGALATGLDTTGGVEPYALSFR